MKISKTILSVALCISLNLNAFRDFLGAINAMQYEISRFEIDKKNIEYLSYGRKQLCCLSIALVLAVLINQNWSGDKKLIFLLIAACIHYPALLHYLGQSYFNKEIRLRREQIKRLEIEASVR